MGWDVGAMVCSKGGGSPYSGGAQASRTGIKGACCLISEQYCTPLVLKEVDDSEGRVYGCRSLARLVPKFDIWQQVEDHHQEKIEKTNLTYGSCSSSWASLCAGGSGSPGFASCGGRESGSGTWTAYSSPFSA